MAPYETLRDRAPSYIDTSLQGISDKYKNLASLLNASEDGAKSNDGNQSRSSLLDK